MTERAAQHHPASGAAVRPDDTRAAAPLDRAVDITPLDWPARGADAARPCDPRLPAPVATAFRRAVNQVRAEKDFGPVCDVLASDDGGALAAISDGVRQAYLGRRCGPVPGGPGALQMLDRLRRAFVEEIDGLRKSLKRGELSRALEAFDRVQAEIERDETHRFLTALKSGEGLDLVVEIAHDMRSPLTAVLMLTETVARAQTGPADELHKRQLALVYSAAFGLNALVNDVIALARGGDRLIDRDPLPFSTSELMHSVADILQPIAEERRLALNIVTPAIDGRVGQPIALGRVLLNLASNALKYTATGEVTVSAVDVCPSHVRFEVADTGPGIPPEVLPALFEPFGKRSAATRSRRFSRTGLGLAICRKLLRDMGSELRVETAAGSGTRFYFELALGVAADRDPSEQLSGSAMF